MKITEISEPILNALREKEFVGYFDVTIYRHGTEYVKIKGFKQNTASFPYDFNCELQCKINEICFKIVSGAISDCGFTFDIVGQIAYSYKHGVEE
jgi:hypothetical protein